MNYLFLIYLYILSYNKLCFGEFTNVFASVSASVFESASASVFESASPSTFKSTSASVSASIFESVSASVSKSIFENAYISQYPSSYNTLLPTSTSIPTRSDTTTSIPIPSSLITYSSYNMCSNTGISIILPNLGSSVLLITNPIGTNYVNYNDCNFYVNGGSASQVFRITIQSMNTEPCCDYLSIFDANNIQIIRYSGIYTSYSFLVSSSSIRIHFISDLSVVASGVVMLITLEYPTQSITSIPTISNRPSLSASKSTLNSHTNTLSESLSKTLTYSISNSKSISESNSIISSYTADSSISNSGSPSDTKSPSQSNSVSYSLSTSSSVTFSPSPSYSATPLPNALPFKLPPKDSNYNKALANQMNDYLNNLLLSDKILPPTQALAVINNIPSIGVSDTLNILKKIGGVISEPVIFSSDSFEGKLAPIKNTTIQVSSNAYNINVPLIPNLPPNSAMIAISWSNTTTFSNETTLSNIMSVSVSNKGVDQSIKNLTTPIVLVWSISDIKIPPNMTLTCSYWNYTSKSWDSDGCNITINNNIECSCNHLTDFVARFERIAKMNENLFKNAGNVYSLEGLKKYQNYYIFYGIYFIIMILIGIGLQQLDIKNSKQYLKSLKHNFDIIKFKKEINNFYIDKCKMNDIIDDFDDYNQYISHKHRLIRKIYNKINSHKNKQELIKLIDLFIDEELDNKHHGINTEDKQLSSDSNKNKKQSTCSNICNIINLWWKRLIYQHNYLSIFFKYDPQSPRIFRIFFIFTIISHTLFMTALLYGYSHGLSGNTDINSPVESIILSLITSFINVPFMNFITKILQLSGKAEFEWRYPFIYREIKKMVIFEEVYYNNNKNISSSENLDLNRENDEESIVTNFIVNYLFKYCNCCSNKNNIKDKDLLFKERINKEVIKLDDIPLDSKWWYTSYLPFHTPISTASFFGCLGYLIWTINYLLLFSADNQPNIQEEILKNFGISQLFSIILITPLTLLFTLIFTWAYHKYINKTNFMSNITPLYYHSDPYVNNKSFGLTIKLTKSLFLKSIAESSIHQPTDPRIIASSKGLIAHMLKEDVANYVDKEYYNKVIKYNKINETLNL